MTLADKLKMIGEESQAQRSARASVNLQQSLNMIESKLTGAAKDGRYYFVVNVHADHCDKFVEWARKNGLMAYDPLSSHPFLLSRSYVVTWGTFKDGSTVSMMLADVSILEDGSFVTGKIV